MSIRQATLDDATEIARLMGVLGYPTEPDAMRRRLTAILADPGYATFVAGPPGALTGVVGVMRGVAFNQDAPFSRIVVLVVDDAGRGRGTGAALVAEAERWAMAQGAKSIHVTTASHRDGAHAFYRRVGYSATGTRFHRVLGAGS